jgi:hypothetical protein
MTGDLANLTWISADIPAGAVVFLATGAGDGLNGRLIRATDDLARLAARADEIVEHDLYQLRVHTLDLPTEVLPSEATDVSAHDAP